jgi:hypothetical protein
MSSVLLFLLFNPLSIIVWFIVIITFLIPREYLGLYVWIITIFLISIWASIRTPEIEEGISATLGREIIFLYMIIVVVCIIVRIAITFLKILINNKNNSNNSNQLTEIKFLSEITLIAYGILSAFFLYLFFTNFLERYQPAWEAYSIVLTTTLFVFGCSYLIKNNYLFQRYAFIKNLHFFGYALCFAMMPLVITSFSFSIIAVIETNKIIRQYEKQEIKYCIQGREMQTWLDLTPLTTWNKSTGSPYSPGKNHAVLVIQTSNMTHLYNWSYKLRRWEYLTTGFKPSSFNSPSSLECVLNSNYSKTLPFLFPKPVQLYIGKKKLNIPSKYFPIQETDSLLNIRLQRFGYQELIRFLASPPNFSSVKKIFTKLPSRYSFHTDVYIAAVVDNQKLQNKFKPYVGQKIEQLEGKYGLNKRSLSKTEYVGQRIQYYTTKNGFINTLIECSSDKKTQMNCQHHFIYDGLMYSFNPSEKELENWQKLQTTLINKVESWEIP